MTQSRKDRSNGQSEDVSAQPPRLLSTRDRKMMIVSRRSSIPAFNKSDIRATGEDEKSSMSLPRSFSHSNTRRLQTRQEDSKLAGGYSSSSVSGSLFANLDDRAPTASSNVNRSKNLSDETDGKLLSPHPNLSGTKIATPSSLFGEIMKRAHAENVTNQTKRQENMPFSGADGLNGYDDKDAISKRKVDLIDGNTEVGSGGIPKRRNMFMKYSKNSEYDAPMPPKMNIIGPDDFVVATDQVDHATSSSPQISGVLSSSMSQKSKIGVLWDPTTSMSQIFPHSQSPSKTTSDRRHMTPPCKQNVNRHPKTPDVLKPTFTPTRCIHSPGGSALMRMIDNCMSPHLSHLKKSIMAGEDGQESRSSTGSTYTVLDDWNETWINIPKSPQIDIDDRSEAPIVEVGIMDWSIKSSIKIECYPSDCIPGKPFLKDNNDDGLSFSAYHSESTTDQLAFELFSNPEKVICIESINKNREDLLCARWKAACMYWQYPMVHDYLRHFTSYNAPYSSGGLRRMTSLSSNDSAPGSRGQSSSNILQQQNDHIESSFQSYANIVRGNGVRKNIDKRANYFDRDTLIKNRRKEWQQCFKSTYTKWITRIHEANESQTSLNLSREYFYCLSDEYTIVFRVIRKTIDEKIIHSPLILLSFSTEEMRTAITSMGISLKVWDSDLDSFGVYKQTDEPTIKDCSAEKVKPSRIDVDGVDLRKELQDLRKSTHENVSADMAILTTNIIDHGRMHSRPKDTLPLMMVDHDDCVAFCELFLNSYGYLYSARNNDRNLEQMDIPLILSRYLGPAQFMTLCSLSSSHKKNDPAHTNDKSSDSIASIDLSGIILPCGLNDIIISSASHFQLHSKNEKGMKDSIVKPQCDEMFDADSDSIGSHYFVMHLRMDQESDDKSVDSKGHFCNPIGSKGSLHLNSLYMLKNTESKQVHEPKRSNVISLVIWDVNRPCTLTIKEDSYVEHQQI